MKEPISALRRFYQRLMGISSNFQVEARDDYDWRLGPWRKGRNPDGEDIDA